jgi:ribonuclease Z
MKTLGSRAIANDFGASEHLRVFVCGSASPLGNTPDRAQACIAVVTPDHFFVFDVGAGSAARLISAGLPHDRLDGVFLTHFHSDHIADLPAIKLNSWVVGRNGPLKVFGPAGVQQVVDGFNLAYGQDNTYRTEHHGRDFMPPVAGTLAAVTNESDTPMSFGDLTITQFEVTHDPIEPAVGYRVDYKGRSVVISGDSIVSENLFKHAAGADLLFHDALSPRLLTNMIDVAKDQGRDRFAKIMSDVQDYHADVHKLEVASQEAVVGQLVLYHLVPTPINGLFTRIWQTDLTSNTVLANDKMVFVLPSDSEEIVINE